MHAFKKAYACLSGWTSKAENSEHLSRSNSDEFTEITTRCCTMTSWVESVNPAYWKTALGIITWL